MGRDPRRDAESLGSVLMSLMIRRAIERGYKRFDFLRGEESYKRRWTRTTRSCYEFVVIRTGWRGALLCGLDWVARKRARVWVPS
jgi:CelD/BcsL family acetyltransferase involved in cellulose biosynthesis